MFILSRGKTKIMYFEGDTAREVRNGGAVCITDSATVVPPRNDTTDRFIGVARRNDTVTDSALVPVEVPIEQWVEWEADVDSDAGLVDSDVGAAVAFDTTGGNNVLGGDSAGMRIDRDDVTFRAFRITKRISGTKAIGVFCRSASIINDTVS